MAHRIYWDSLKAADASGSSAFDRSTDLGKVMETQFGSDFIQIFNKKAKTIQGSGWCWLVLNKLTNVLEIVTTKEHEIPCANTYAVILTIDVWEHAFYMTYKSRKGEYLDNIWKCINWNKANERYTAAEAELKI